MKTKKMKRAIRFEPAILSLVISNYLIAEYWFYAEKARLKWIKKWMLTYF